MRSHLRVAKPVADLERTVAMYCAGLEMSVLGRFSDHDGFDGAMLGREGADHHLEFTRCRRHPVQPTPTPEDLLVFYLPQRAEWEGTCARMRAAGFREVAAHNPYWDRDGRSFEDADGYRVVLQNAPWTNRAVPPANFA